MRRIIKFFLNTIVIVCFATYALQLVHVCDECDDVFIGTGYKAGIISDMISEKNKTLCKNCAKKQHSISSLVGKSLSDYKIEMEWNPINVIKGFIE